MIHILLVALALISTISFAQNTFTYNLNDFPDFFFTGGAAIAYSTFFLVTPNVTEKTGSIISKEKLESSDQWEMQFIVEFNGNPASHSQGLGLWLSDYKLPELKQKDTNLYGYDIQSKGCLLLALHSSNDTNNPLYQHENGDALVVGQFSKKTKSFKRSALRQQENIQVVDLELFNKNTTIKLSKRENNLIIYALNSSTGGFDLLMNIKLAQLTLKKFFFGITGTTINTSAQIMKIHKMIYVSDTQTTWLKKSVEGGSLQTDDLLQLYQNESFTDIYDLTYQNISLGDLEKTLGNFQSSTERRLANMLEELTIILKEEALIKELVNVLKYTKSLNVTENHIFIKFQMNLQKMVETLMNLTYYFDELDQVLEQKQLKLITNTHLDIMDNFSKRIKSVENAYLEQITANEAALSELIEIVIEHQKFSEEKLNTSNSDIITNMQIKSSSRGSKWLVYLIFGQLFLLIIVITAMCKKIKMNQLSFPEVASIIQRSGGISNTHQSMGLLFNEYFIF